MKAARLFNRAAQSEAADDNTADVPTLRSIHPEFAAIDDRFRDLCAQENELLEKLKPLLVFFNNRQLMGAAAKSFIESGKQVAPAELTASEKAANILLGDLGKIDPQTVTQQFDPKEREAAVLAEELEAVRKARAVLAPKLERARIEGSAKLCRARHEEYQLIVASLHGALLMMKSVLEKNEAFIASFRDQGATASPMPLVPTDELNLGLLRRTQHRASELFHLGLSGEQN